MPDDESPKPAAPHVPDQSDELMETAGSEFGSKERTAARIELVRQQIARGYSPTHVITWLTRPSTAKPWSVSKGTAKTYLEKAMAEDYATTVQPRDKKQAQSRARLSMVFNRAMALAEVQPLKAAGLLTAAIAAIDKIARIDGAYEFDASTLVPRAITVASPEEAVRIVKHASATVELAQRRGAIAAPRRDQPTVIDAVARDVDEVEPSDDAN
jgi:hypothetical protein